MNKKSFKELIKKLVAPYRLLWGYYYDYKRFLKSSFLFNRNKLSMDNLRAEITFEYHSIEKGLSHSNLRLGFGQKRVKRLMELLNMWLEKGYPTTDDRFNTGIVVLQKYILIHQESGYSVKKVEDEVNALVNKTSECIKDIRGGAFLVTSSGILSSRKLDFEKFSHSRRSIRNYGEEKVELSSIRKAIKLAQNAPSVCNRQSSKVYVLTSQEMIKQCLLIQNGIQGMAENISALIVVTSDNQYFGNLNERNQSFVDGGLYSMNLLYSLTYQGIASCALNANLNTKSMEKLRKLLSIPSSEDFIMFISCGSYPDEIKIPVSYRDSIDTVMTVID